MALMLTNLKVIGKFDGAPIISEAFTFANVFLAKNSCDNRGVAWQWP
jgi:hypothetical protein